MIIEFGKYKGTKLENVPQEYLLWLLDMRKKDVKLYQDELDRRELAEAGSLSMVERIASVGFKTLALKLHPDQGGSQEEFLELRAAQEQLKTLIQEVKAIKEGA